MTNSNTPARRLTLEDLHAEFEARTPEASAMVTAAQRAALDGIAPIVPADLDTTDADVVHRLNQAIRILVGFMLTKGEVKALAFDDMPPVVRAFLAPLLA